MNSATKTGTYLLPLLAGSAMLLSATAGVQAQQTGQQAGLLRPSLDVENNLDGLPPASTQAPVQQTNAPRAITLQTNQPQSQPLPPPPLPPRQPEADPFGPTGMRVGSFRLFPVLEITTDFSDNVRSSSNNKKKDVGLRLAPSLRLESDWVRHSLNFNASGESVFYAKTDDENSNTFTASTDLRLDIRRDVNLLNSITYQLSETSSSSSEVPGTAIGNRKDHRLTYTSALTSQFNRMVATLTGGIDWRFFDDVKLAGGGTENNADREYIEPSLLLRLGYEISPAVTPFIEAGYTPRIHAQTLDRNGIRRNSIGLTASAGIGFNLSPIWDGEVALTYDYRNFDDNSLTTVNSVGVNATINWRPTQLTTVTFQSTTGIDESSTAGISGTRTLDLNVDLSHRFRENLTGNLGFGFNYSDFVGSSNDDMNYTMNAGLAYAIRRQWEWVANYQFTRFKSGTAGNSYSENRISTGIRFRL
ncbi:hypothetical protein MNBD_ALPHA08-1377 [hydrothermal vent metagenome]|uniref:Uncharacterized protein n=1 Tax=hydrothermal vent metagenome TaxID=652676 RepID=A0A3B0SGC0_9ZZZZ